MKKKKKTTQKQSKIEVFFEQIAAYLSAFRYPKNFILTLKYPFLKSRNVWNYKFLGYRTTWYDDIPDGWRNAFGKQLLEDIVKALKEDKIPKRKWEKTVHFDQIKEKFGELRLYATTTKKVDAVLERYELLSQGYCYCCGNPARYRTSGWIEYFCENCYQKYIENLYSCRGTKEITEEQRVEMQEDKENDRLTEEDIPVLSSYSPEKDEYVEVDLKEKYNIDFKGLWGLIEK